MSLQYEDSTFLLFGDIKNVKLFLLFIKNCIIMKNVTGTVIVF